MEDQALVLDLPEIAATAAEAPDQLETEAQVQVQLALPVTEEPAIAEPETTAQLVTETEDFPETLDDRTLVLVKVGRLTPLLAAETLPTKPITIFRSASTTETVTDDQRIMVSFDTIRWNSRLFAKTSLASTMASTTTAGEPDTITTTTIGAIAHSGTRTTASPRSAV